ncbi:Na/K ATPase-like protein alpha 1 subunit [Glonium stellatum]|uniref:Na/K ATPase-like protein alpha 1 subunit n=1 Tax=Glonium stellatum TaxID=574774 RepID=A0A8E2JSD1_9PEZI|nr:Na/K ATPase-like protein alpha 1 subunit [Glonium stellatum]
MDDAIKGTAHIRYAVDDEIGVSNRRPDLRRCISNGSEMSIHAVSNRIIEPEAALPITYRTLSYEVDETLEKERSAARRRKEKATIDLAGLEWHIITPDELYRRLSVSVSQGLSNDQVKRRMIEYGKNKPTAPPSRLFQKIIGYLFGGFGPILLVASILVFVCWKPLGNPPAPANLALAIVLLAVFFIQAAFNAWQDWSSSRVMASITTMLPDQCLVLRDGVQARISAIDLVPGDIIFIKQGNKLPADVRFVEICTNTLFDRSILTGESEAVVGSVESTDDNYLETHCIGLQGTHCISGSGLGVCIATGDSTVFGRIAKLTNQPKGGMTTLQNEIFRFVLIITTFIVVIVLLVIILWAAWLRRDHPEWINVPSLIVDCVSVAVAFIPEGLPIALTMSLTIVANIMRKNKILCKSLATVETLGAVSVICSDKTGTLTKNKMYVTDVFAGGEKYTPEAARDKMSRLRSEADDTTQPSRPDDAIEQVRILAGLCNAGDFDASTAELPLNERKINGDATDQAILRLSESLGSVSELRKSWKKTFEIGFNSKNKFMIRLMARREDSALGNQQCYSDNLTLMIKGAPDILLSRCASTVIDDGGVAALARSDIVRIEQVKDSWSRQGKRVILLAQKDFSWDGPKALSSNPEREVLVCAQQGLTFVGLVGIVDPPRDEIPEVVRILRGASIRIFMVTGDFKLTAQAIAQECGIITNPALLHDVTALSGEIKEASPYRSIILSGPELISLSQFQWDQLCQYDEIVFARTTPEQKLRIVKEFQARDNVVGMTGDGVNDAPSLKAADIGIAMGSGSDIAIEAADMVLLDSFAAIVEAVQYGRLVYDNLKKTIVYLLPAGSFSELWPVVTNVLFGLPQILSSFLMIIICCFTDCAGAITLAYEKPEADVLLRPPRNRKKDRLVDPRLIFHAYFFVGIIECFLSFTMAFWYMQRKGVPFSAMWLKYGVLSPQFDAEYVTKITNEASSIYFVSLVVMQLFNLLATRTRRLSIFQQPPIFNRATQNPLLFLAMLFALTIIFIFCYIPGLQHALSTTRVPVEHFFLPAAFGLGVLGLDEGRKFAARKWPRGVLAGLAW